MKPVKLLFLNDKMQIMLTRSNILKSGSDNNLYISPSNESTNDKNLFKIFGKNLNNGLYSSESFLMDGYDIKIQISDDGKQKQINFGSTGKRINHLILEKMGNCNLDDLYAIEFDSSNNSINIHKFIDATLDFKKFLEASISKKTKTGYSSKSQSVYSRNLEILYKSYKIYFTFDVPELIMKREEFPNLNKNNNEFSATINAYIRFLSESKMQETGVGMKYKQKILIGPPGSGKSYLLNNEELGNVTRVVFHPDYDNSDFVGSILPELIKNEKGETHIEYRFKKGPFTKIYKDAINPQNNKKKYTLLIEEMTRGNCAAIFGEIFQLLDRDENGYSEYPITNHNIDSEPIKLPPNLSIVGTVNSSDQNVFPMDTAFKRRFDLEYIEPINENAIDFKILGVSWKALCTSINNLICNNQHLAEDKQIGFYFIKGSSLKDIQKLCIYLWHDVDKFIHDNDDKILNHSNCNNYATFNKKIKVDSNVMDLFNKLISSELKNEEN